MMGPGRIVASVSAEASGGTRKDVDLICVDLGQWLYEKQLLAVWL